MEAKTAALRERVRCLARENIESPERKKDRKKSSLRTEGMERPALRNGKAISQGRW